MARSEPHGDDIDRLFGVDLARFTAERDALARAIQQEGDRELAKRVKAMKRPTLPAWGVNQLARRHAAELEALRAIDTKLRRAQDAALEGRATGDELRELSGERRDRVAQLVRLAGAILTEAGHSASAEHLREIDQTLSASATDPSLAELIAGGRLERAAEPSSLASMLAAGGDLASAAARTASPPAARSTPPAPAPRPRDAAKPKGAEGQAATPTEKSLAAQRAREEREQREEQRQRQQLAERARREAEQLARIAEEATRTRDRLLRKAEELDELAKQARARAQAAADAATHAQERARDAAERAAQTAQPPKS